jgi:hypothetical protein
MPTILTNWPDVNRDTIENLVSYTIVPDALSLFAFEREGVVWNHLRSVNAIYPGGFFSLTHAAKTKELVKALRAAFAGDASVRASSFVLVDVASKCTCVYWGIGIPASIADYVRSAEYEADLRSATSADATV